MKKTADDFYYFIVSIKYGLQIMSIKKLRSFTLTAVACYPIMYLYVRNVRLEGIDLPMTSFFNFINILFFIFTILTFISFIFMKKIFYEPLIWFLTSIAFLEFSYILIIIEYTAFLEKLIPYGQERIWFNFVLSIPVILLTMSLLRYSYKIKLGRAHKNDTKVISLEKKYKEQSMNALQNLSKVQRHTVSIALIGVGLGSFLESSFTLFLFFFICAGIISWTTAKFLIVAYIKFKFPEQYLDENIEKMLKKERIQKK